MANFNDINTATSKVSIVLKYATSKASLESDKSVPTEVKKYILNHPVLPLLLDLRELLDAVYHCSDRDSGAKVLSKVQAKALEIYNKIRSLSASDKVHKFANYLSLRKDGILN